MCVTNSITELQIGDEIMWNDGSLSMILALNESTFHELTQFGHVFEQCYPAEGERIGWKKTGRRFSQLDEIVKMMQEASEVDE